MPYYLQLYDFLWCHIQYFFLKKRPKIFDLGAGYGFFRYAVGEKGLPHAGLEISQYANQMCKKLFGFNNFHGDIWDYNKKNKVRSICDFIAGMTDRFAIDLYNSIKWIFLKNT